MHIYHIFDTFFFDTATYILANIEFILLNRQLELSYYIDFTSNC